MAVSEVDAIINGTGSYDGQTAEQRLTALATKYTHLMTLLFKMRGALDLENDYLNALMDANGDNANEHHAKTMVFYGRKLSVKDVIFSVDTNSQSYKDSPNVSPFYGINSIVSNTRPYSSQALPADLACGDIGRFTITWLCKSDTLGLDAYYKTGELPATANLVQTHMAGSKVQMPSIRNLDNNGTGLGTNTYKLKNGYTFIGWQHVAEIDSNATPFYLYKKTCTVSEVTDPTTQTKKTVVSRQVERYEDHRVFEYGWTEKAEGSLSPGASKNNVTFELPYPEEPSGASGGATIPIQASFTLVPRFVASWFTITFVVRHGEARTTAPCRTPIKTCIGKTIVLPLTTEIDMDTGWEIDKDSEPYGEWTTVDPSTGVTPTDEDGDPLPEISFAAGSTNIVGTDINPGIRTLYLKIKATVTPT